MICSVSNLLTSFPANRSDVFQKFSARTKSRLPTHFCNVHKKCKKLDFLSKGQWTYGPTLCIAIDTRQLLSIFYLKYSPKSHKICSEISLGGYPFSLPRIGLTDRGPSHFLEPRDALRKDLIWNTLICWTIGPLHRQKTNSFPRAILSILYFQCCRAEHKELNYFTTEQIVILRREIVKLCLKNKGDPLNMIYPMLHEIRPSCVKQNLLAALHKANK